MSADMSRPGRPQQIGMERNAVARDVTFMPKAAALLAGWHEAMDSSRYLAMMSVTEKTGQDLDRSYETRTVPVDPQISLAASSLATHKAGIASGALTAADFNANADNLANLVLIRLHQQLMGRQQEWFHLDEMFNTMNLDKTVYRMAFQDNPAAAQRVGRREQYDTAEVKYDDIDFDLPKTVVSYDMPIEDPLRALISPVIPLQQNNEFSLKLMRERDALAALQALGNHYTKDGTGTGKFTATSAPTNNATKRINDPADITTGNVHSDVDVATEFQDANNAFFKTYDIPITHYACSPKTAMAIARNTWTQPNTIFNVEAYRTNGGVRPFPGLSDVTMVISLMCPDNVLYAVSKPSGIMTKAEGPKIMRTWEDNGRFVTQTAKADFYQYKCAHEDLSNISRKFGFIVDINTS